MPGKSRREARLLGKQGEKRVNNNNNIAFCPKQVGVG
jgi:hypothetical protein